MELWITCSPLSISLMQRGFQPVDCFLTMFSAQYALHTYPQLKKQDNKVITALFHRPLYIFNSLSTLHVHGPVDKLGRLKARP
jgi:hypothetical protein